MPSLNACSQQGRTIERIIPQSNPFSEIGTHLYFNMCRLYQHPLKPTELAIYNTPTPAARTEMIDDFISISLLLTFYLLDVCLFPPFR